MIHHIFSLLWKKRMKRGLLDMTNQLFISEYNARQKRGDSVMERLSEIDFTAIKGFICDMDGVIYHGNQILPGVREFIQWLQETSYEKSSID